MRHLFAAALVLTTAGLGVAFAQEAEPVTVVDVGTPLVNLLIAYASVLGSAVAAFASWVMWKLTKIKLDAEARQSIETFATNAAGEFLGRFDSLKGIKIDVRNPIIAQLAQAALTRIPDGLARFGWTADQVTQRIVEKIGVLTASTPAVVEAAEAATKPEPT